MEHYNIIPFLFHRFIDSTAYQIQVYYTPWCRMSAYIIGIWTGYIIFNQGSKKLELSPVRSKENLVLQIPLVYDKYFETITLVLEFYW